MRRCFCELKRKNRALERYLRLLVSQRSNLMAIAFNTTMFVFVAYETEMASSTLIHPYVCQQD